jgi:hypothetical protein
MAISVTELTEAVGTLGVIASLVFVGLQVRQNTIAVRAQVHQDITNSYLAVAETVTAHASAFASGISATPEAFAALSDEDKLIYFGVIFGFFKHFENMFGQYERGLIDSDSWAAWSEHILMYYRQPGVQIWWNLRGPAFTPKFREFLENSPAPKVKSMVDVMRDKA